MAVQLFERPTPGEAALAFLDYHTTNHGPALRKIRQELAAAISSGVRTPCLHVAIDLERRIHRVGYKEEPQGAASDIARALEAYLLEALATSHNPLPRPLEVTSKSAPTAQSLRFECVVPLF